MWNIDNLTRSERSIDALTHSGQVSVAVDSAENSSMRPVNEVHAYRLAHSF